MNGIGLEHMQLKDLCAVFLAEVQVGAQAEVEASGLDQPPALEQPLVVVDRPVDAFSAVLYAMTLADSIRQSPRWVPARVVALAHWNVQVRPPVHESVVEAVAVVHMAPEPEEAKQHADAHSAVLGRKIAGHQLAAAPCCSKKCLAHRYFGAQSQYAGAVDDELLRWSVGLVHGHRVAVCIDLGVPAQADHGQERNSVVHESRIAAVQSSQAEATGVAGCYLSKLEVEIYYDHLTLRDVFVPRCFLYYGLHGLLCPSPLSCSRMSGTHCLAGSSLVC